MLRLRRLVVDRAVPAALEPLTRDSRSLFRKALGRIGVSGRRHERASARGTLEELSALDCLRAVRLLEVAHADPNAA